MKDYILLLIMIVLFLLVARIEDPKDYMTQEELISYNQGGNQ